MAWRAHDWFNLWSSSSSSPLLSLNQNFSTFFTNERIRRENDLLFNNSIVFDGFQNLHFQVFSMGGVGWGWGKEKVVVKCDSWFKDLLAIERIGFSTSSLSCPCERVKPVLKACWTPAWSSGSGWWPSVAETSRERNSRSCRLNSSVKQSFGCPRLAGGPGADGPGCRRPVRPRRSKVLVLRELNRSPSGWRELAWLLLTSGSWCSVTRFSVPEKRPRSGCSSGFAGRWFFRCSELGQLKWPGQKISYRNSLPDNRGVMAGAVPSGAGGPLVQSQLHTNVFSLLSMPEEKWIQSWLMLLSLLSM